MMRFGREARHAAFNHARMQPPSAPVSTRYRKGMAAAPGEAAAIHTKPPRLRLIAITPVGNARRMNLKGLGRLVQKSHTIQSVASCGSQTPALRPGFGTK